jgi:hypothetical protein
LVRPLEDTFLARESDVLFRYETTSVRTVLPYAGSVPLIPAFLSLIDECILQIQSALLPSASSPHFTFIPLLRSPHTYRVLLFLELFYLSSVRTTGIPPGICVKYLRMRMRGVQFWFTMHKHINFPALWLSIKKSN